MATVALGDTVILHLNDGQRFFAAVRPAVEVRFRRQRLRTLQLIGAEYGGVYEVQPEGHFTLVPSGQLFDPLGITTESGADNRDLVDTQTSQVLAGDDIRALREAGKSGTEIIAALVENSATFAKKTTFAQEKYLKKKAAKYIVRFRVIFPTVLSVADAMMQWQPDRLYGLRSDSLGHMLAAGNVRAGCRALIIDGIGGMVIGSALTRMGCLGTLVAAHDNNQHLAHMWPHIQKFNLGHTLAANRAAVLAAEAAADGTAGDAVASGSAATATAAGAGRPSAIAATDYAALAAAGLTFLAVPYLLMRQVSGDEPTPPPPVAAAASGADEALGAVAGRKRGRAAAMRASAGDAGAPASVVPETELTADATGVVEADASADDGEGEGEGEGAAAGTASGADDGSGAEGSGVDDEEDEDNSGSGADAGEGARPAKRARKSGASARDSDADAAAAGAGVSGSAGDGTAPASVAAVPAEQRAEGWRQARRAAAAAASGASGSGGVDPAAWQQHALAPARLRLAERRAQLLRGFDCLLIAANTEPLAPTLAALRFARPSAAVAVFCQEMQPLAELFETLRRLGVVTRLELTETWKRPYQVLSERTHPTMDMHGASGYLLTGIVIASPYSCIGAAVGAATGDGESASSATA